MHTWTKEHSRFIGRIIFANFLKLPLERYKNIIEEVEGSILFNKSSRNGCIHRNNNSGIIIKRLSEAGISHKKTSKSSKIVAEIAKNTKGFSIRYTYDGFNKIYIIHSNLCFIHVASRLFHKLRRINSRNGLTHKIIKGVIEYQKKFLSTGDPNDLVPFSQVQLANQLNGSKLQKIDNSWISRLVNGLSVIIPSGEERILKSFFPTRRDKNKRLIKKLLDKENDPALS